MALQFTMVAMSAALRGTGIVKPTMLVQMISVIINIILAPVLITGWGTGYAMGIAGAGLASSIAVVCALLLLIHYFRVANRYISVDFSLWHPDSNCLKKVLNIGFPAGGEFFLMFIYMATIYWAIQQFGAGAQAGFGLGSRIMQSLFLPAMALAFASPAVAGQNYAAGQFARVRDTFRWSLILTSSLMALLLFLCLWQATLLVKGFSDDVEVILVSVTFLQLICLNFIPAGINFSCSGMFQALGNTWPALFSTATRLVSFVIPAVWLALQSDFQIEQLWYLSIITVYLQAGMGLYLLNREFNKRLQIQRPSRSAKVQPSSSI